MGFFLKRCNDVLLFFIIILTCNISAKAQRAINVSGRVYADSAGTPVSNASVTVLESKKGTTTNKDGVFALTDIIENATIEISYIGFISFRIKVSELSADRPIILQSIAANSQEVVVTGYQTIKKKDYVGAAANVKVSDVAVPSLGTLDKMLQGQVAGVAIQNTSSVFGTAPQIRVRGSSSLSGINEPLWVLDGVPLEASLNIAPSELYAGNARNLLASSLANVNPDDIEDITVLKDATATAMYGTRAVNGVIIITTKRPRKNAPLRVNYSFNGTVSLKPSILDFNVLNSKDQITLNQEIFEIYQSSLLNYSAAQSGPYSKLLDQYNRRIFTEQEFRERVRDLKVVNTDWFDHLYKNTLLQQHSLSLSQGGEKSSSRLAFSYYDDPGKALGEKTKRVTANFINIYQITSRFSAELLVKYANRSQDNAGTKVNPFIYARDASRAARPFDEYGSPEFYKKGFSNFNMLHEINNDFIRLKSNDFAAQLNLNYNILRNMRFSTLINGRFSNSSVNEIQTEFSNYANQFREDNFNIRLNNTRLYKRPGSASYELPSTVLPEGGILDRETVEAAFFTARGQVEWELLKNNHHVLNLFGGMEATLNEQTVNFARNYGYRGSSNSFAASPLAYERLLVATNLPEDEKRIYAKRNLLQGTNAYINDFTRSAVSFYVNGSYNFKSRYVIDATLRNDATNVSGRSTRNRFLPTWSVGASWNFTDEAFFKGAHHVVTAGKLRVSYGLRGNSAYRGSELIAYYNNVTRNYPVYNTAGVEILESENTALEFEKEYMFSTGIDLSIARLVDMTFNYYSRKNFDLVADKEVQPSSGFITKTFNWADMVNKGIEFSFNSRPLRIAKNFAWSGMLNFTYNKNEIVSDLRGNSPSVFDATVSAGYALKGRPQTGLYGFDFAGLNSNGLATYRNSKGQLVPAFLISDRDLGNIVYLGSRDPLYSGGFNSNFMYKDISIGIAFVFNAGHVVRKADLYRANSQSSLYRDDLNFNSDFRYRWLSSGDEQFTDVPRLILPADFTDYARQGYAESAVLASYNRSDIRTINASYLRLRNITLQYNLKALAPRLGMKNLSAGLEASNLAVFASKMFRGTDPETLLTGLNMPPLKSFTFNLSATF